MAPAGMAKAQSPCILFITQWSACSNLRKPLSRRPKRKMQRHKDTGQR